MKECGVGVFVEILWQKKMVPTTGNWGQKGACITCTLKIRRFVQYDENMQICKNPLHTV